MTNSEINLNYIGIKSASRIQRNLSRSDLIQIAVVNGDGILGKNVSLMVDTGKYTGRSPKDKYIVRNLDTDRIVWWGNVNQPISENTFNELLATVIDHYNQRPSEDIFTFDGFCGDDANYAMPIRFITKKAWQVLFTNSMFINTKTKSQDEFTPRFTMINASGVVNPRWKEQGLHSDCFIAFHFGKGIGLIGGTEYAGEMKKGIFTVMNYYLPKKGVLPMHCAANVDLAFGNPALFFGLSGTGKTTLSTAPDRILVGDDEHAWSNDGVFNLEGGCYAKAIRLNKEHEPDIWNAIRDGAILENVIFDSVTKEVDFDDDAKTENTRVCYPLEHIEKSMRAKGLSSHCEHPGRIVFLSCDAYGVLPPVAKLTPEQAMYHFISGYTAKVAGTERGIIEPKATFSPCFGEPFLPLHPFEYAAMFKEKIMKHQVTVYLVNTGWIGGTAADGVKRIPIQISRAIVSSIVGGKLENATFRQDPIFGFYVPDELDGVDKEILSPEISWTDKTRYEDTKEMLAKKFIENAEKFVQKNPELLLGSPVL